MPALFAAFLLVFGADTADIDTVPPAPSEKNVLVELFTSEGCSSCPPADQFLADLKRYDAARGRIIPISFHVDYWDDIGWRDPFSAAAFSSRQWIYARKMQLSSAYTPQAVIDGTHETLGSRRSKIWEAIQKQMSRPANVALEMSVDTRLSGRARVLARVGVIRRPDDSGPANAATANAGLKWIFAASILPQASSSVTSGENGGRTLRHVNVVRTLADPVPVRMGRDGGRAEFQLMYLSGMMIVSWIQDHKTLVVEQAAIWDPDHPR